MGAYLQKEEVNGNRGQIEKYTKVDAELGLWGLRDCWFVCNREGKNKTMNNAHINYILSRVSVHVKKMAKCLHREKFLLLTNLAHFFMCLFIYFIYLHVSSITMLITRRSNTINTSSGMISLLK